MSVLRKQLRKSGVELFDSYPPYGAWFRRRFGIENEQALNLFLQTVSLKEVGNLTDFVRNHMLEPFDVAPRVEALVKHFDDLNRAHEAVLKAKRQVEMLEPLVADCEKHRDLEVSAGNLKDCRDALHPWFAMKKMDLLEKHLSFLNEELDRHNEAVARLEEKRREQRGREHEIQLAISENGGDRIKSIELEIQRKKIELERCKAKASQYGELVKSLGQHPATTQEEFLRQQSETKAWRETVDQEVASADYDRTNAEFEFKQGNQEYDLLKKEIASLKTRVSNIDEKQVALRRLLCQSVGVPEEEMPFIGELIQVLESERDWEGAIERLLHSFGLSILVPDRHYAKVMEWVNRTDLRGRLIYFR
jgi:uncharacterized protein YPO0396